MQGSGDEASGNEVFGNFIGTDATGTIDVGGDGVSVLEGSGNVIGDASPEAGNLISGNDAQGVVLFGLSDNRVEGNLIGTRKDGTSPLGNGRAGVGMFRASDNTVGGATPGAATTSAGGALTENLVDAQDQSEHGPGGDGFSPARFLDGASRRRLRWLSSRTMWPASLRAADHAGRRDASRNAHHYVGHAK